MISAGRREEEEKKWLHIKVSSVVGFKIFANYVYHSTMEESFTKHLPFSLLSKNLKKNKVLKHNPQIILGFFDPHPVLLAEQGGGAKDQKIPE